MRFVSMSITTLFIITLMALLWRSYAVPKMGVNEQKPFLFVVPVSGRPASMVLEEHIKNGWRVVLSTPLGGSDGTNFMALLILERVGPGNEETWPVANGNQADPKTGKPIF